MTRHFLNLSDAGGDAIAAMINDAQDRKAARLGWPKGRTDADAPLSGRVLAMIFDKNSTRTRVSFDIAMRQLGGQTIPLNHADLQTGRGEPVADTAKVLSRYADAIMIRANKHATLTEMAENASVPVINGLTERSHPCQIIADIMTLEESKGAVGGQTVAWVGDGNNVATSWIHAAVRLGFKLRIACPPQLNPEKDVMEWVKREGGSIELTDEAEDAVKGADCVVTDTWISMGQSDGPRRKQLLAPYAVDDHLMRGAAKDAIFMHCLPAYRGLEVAASVIDGPQSVVFDEAENRLHAQKAILAWCLGVD
jgi:ornithine carbamoyltransferase